MPITSKLRTIFLLVSICFLVSACGTEIYTENKGRNLNPSIDDSNPDGSEPGLPNEEQMIALKFVGSCYKYDDKKGDKYCIDLESETALDVAEFSSLTEAAVEYCENEWKAELNADACVKINDSMNEFKKVVDQMDNSKLCMDERKIESFRVKTSHILVEKGILQFDNDDEICEKKKK